MNDKTKSEMVGALFVNLVNDKLTKENFTRLCFIIESLYIDDLLYFVQKYLESDSKSKWSRDQILSLSGRIDAPSANPILHDQVY